jgi:hypothetical protein
MFDDALEFRLPRQIIEWPYTIEVPFAPEVAAQRHRLDHISFGLLVPARLRANAGSRILRRG